MDVDVHVEGSWRRRLPGSPCPHCLSSIRQWVKVRCGAVFAFAAVLRNDGARCGGGQKIDGDGSRCHVQTVLSTDPVPAKQVSKSEECGAEGAASPTLSATFALGPSAFKARQPTRSRDSPHNAAKSGSLRAHSTCFFAACVSLFPLLYPRLPFLHLHLRRLCCHSVDCDAGLQSELMAMRLRPLASETPQEYP